MPSVSAITGAPGSSLATSVCYKFLMKIIEQWLLYKYVNGEFTPLSKPFKTKAQAEKARLKLPERQRRRVGVGVVRREGWYGFRLDLCDSSGPRASVNMVAVREKGSACKKDIYRFQ